MSRRTRKKKFQRQAATVASSSSFNENLQTLIAQMQAKLQPGTNNVIYGPGMPLTTMPGVDPDGYPRQYAFPLMYNTNGVNRSLNKPDIPGFEQLRMMSKMYSGITLCERVWLDMVTGLKLEINLRPDLLANGMDESSKDIQKDISGYKQFFEKPDKERDLHSWLKMAIRDQTQIDELYIYKHRNRNGSLYSLELIDGATMKPLLDDWGRIPAPPLPAYQQFPWGLPGMKYTVEDMIRYNETPQIDSPYGFSRVERFILEVNQGLRKKKRDLAMFTEGNIPTGIMEAPADSNWTPDQIDIYEKMWNALIAGSPQQQVRVKFTQAGFKYVKTDTDEILTDFDLFLYNIACGIYGLSLADIGVTGDIHKSSDDGQQNMMFRRTLRPIVLIYGEILTQILRDEFDDDRFVVRFGGYDEVEDMAQQATTFATLAGIGAIAPSDIAHIMKLPDVPKTGPFIMTKTGPFFLSDYEEGSEMRTAQQQATMSGMQLAAQGGQQQNQEEEDSEEDDTSNKEQSAKTGIQGESKKSVSNSDEQQKDPSSSSKDKKSIKRSTEGEIDASNYERDSRGDEIRAELKRWRTCALHDAERGRKIRHFESIIIPTEERERIATALAERGRSVEEVKAIFKQAQEDESFLAAGGNGDRLMQSRIDWRVAVLP